MRSYDQMIAAGELKVAALPGLAPYGFEDQANPEGVDVELAQALAEALGVRLQLMWAPPGEKLDDDLRDYIWRSRSAARSTTRRPDDACPVRS